MKTRPGRIPPYFLPTMTSNLAKGLHSSPERRRRVFVLIGEIISPEMIVEVGVYAAEAKR